MSALAEKWGMAVRRLAKSVVLSERYIYLRSMLTPGARGCSRRRPER
jgi:hypothetical protein